MVVRVVAQALGPAGCPMAAVCCCIYAAGRGLAGQALASRAQARLSLPQFCDPLWFRLGLKQWWLLCEWMQGIDCPPARSHHQRAEGQRRVTQMLMGLTRASPEAHSAAIRCKFYVLVRRCTSRGNSRTQAITHHAVHRLPMRRATPQAAAAPAAARLQSNALLHHKRMTQVPSITTFG